MFDYESKDNSIHRPRDKICAAMGLSSGLQARLAKNLTIIELRHMIHDGLKVPKIDKFYRTSDGKATISGEDWWRSAVAEHPADLYIVDPFRCLHGGAENDSAIEETLRLIRSVFRRTTIIPHHTVKSSRNPKENVRLVDNMRLWSEQCRGSGAIKGHADLIVCQEREIQDDTEIVYFGGFMKDSADIDPIPLVESAQESFLYVPHTDLPAKLAAARDVLVAAGITSWPNRSAMADTLIAGESNALLGTPGSNSSFSTVCSASGPPGWMLESRSRGLGRYDRQRSRHHPPRTPRHSTSMRPFDIWRTWNHQRRSRMRPDPSARRGGGSQAFLVWIRGVE